MLVEAININTQDDADVLAVSDTNQSNTFSDVRVELTNADTDVDVNTSDVSISDNTSTISETDPQILVSDNNKVEVDLEVKTSVSSAIVDSNAEVKKGRENPSVEKVSTVGDLHEVDLEMNDDAGTETKVELLHRIPINEPSVVYKEKTPHKRHNNFLLRLCRCGLYSSTVEAYEKVVLSTVGAWDLSTPRGKP